MTSLTLWILLAALTALALALLLVPLLRHRGTAASRADFDIEIYLDQLRELERDTARGIIEPAEAGAARIEIEKRLLAADRARSGATPGRPASRHTLVAVLLIIGVPALALTVYTRIGSPALPDQPFAERAVNPDSDLIARTAVEVAEAEAAVRIDPGDATAWFRLGRLRLFAQQWERSAGAFAEAARLDPTRADYAAAHGEALVFGAGGTVTPQARAAFDEALARDPRDPRARYYRALAAQQTGDGAGALQAYVALWRDAPPDAPWRDRLADRIRTLATELGEDVAALMPAAPAAPGPNADDVAAAQQMAPDDRTAMIRSMVERLETRLVETPDDLDGWRRLGQSWTVLGEPAKASQAYEQALALAPMDPETLFRGAVAALDAGDRTAALDRFRRLLPLVPPDSDAAKAVERAIGDIEAAAPPAPAQQ